MLALVMARLAGARELDGILVATSTDAEDDQIADLAQSAGWRCYRGARDDVLGRFVAAVEGHEGEVVRITADCPLIDAEVVDEVIRLFRSSRGCVYASNIEPRSYPVGLDTEVVSAQLLRELADTADDPADREHVTMALRRDPARFPREVLVAREDLSALRWTVDYEDDLEFVRLVVERLGERRYAAGWEEVLEAVRAEPTLANFHGQRG